VVPDVARDAAVPQLDQLAEVVAALAALVAELEAGR
jgi:hypothetical protein